MKPKKKKPASKFAFEKTFLVSMAELGLFISLIVALIQII